MLPTQQAVCACSLAQAGSNVGLCGIHFLSSHGHQAMLYKHQALLYSLQQITSIECRMYNINLLYLSPASACFLLMTFFSVSAFLKKTVHIKRRVHRFFILGMKLSIFFKYFYSFHRLNSCGQRVCKNRFEELLYILHKKNPSFLHLVL